MKRTVTKDLLTRLVVSLLPLSTLKGCAFLGDPCPKTSPPYIVTVDGGISDAGLKDAGCAETCKSSSQYFGGVTSCQFELFDGQTGVRCTSPGQCEPAGRRPEGLSLAVHSAQDPVGAFLARQAHLEAASVPAFHRLASELLANGAPHELVQAAQRAADDEVRHASIMTAAARRHGAEPAPVEIAPPRDRTLEEIVIENAVEGCVRETLGAMIALWQSHRAADPWLRRVMAVIAEDELTHSELAWQIDAWARTILSPESNQRVESARRAEIAALTAALEAPSSDILLTQVGIPDAATTLRLLTLGMRQLDMSVPEITRLRPPAPAAG